ncbi:MAG: proton-conducting transporter membrane subunit [Cyclobacteriaceae bacterium]
MANNLIILPVVFQLFIAVLLLAFRQKIKTQRFLSILLSIVALGLSVWMFADVWRNGIITMQAGSWSAPFGISLVADVLSSTLVLLTTISGLAVSIYSAATIDTARQKFAYFPVLHFLLMGLNGAFLTGDIFNLYVWFEIIIIASFVLITLGAEKDQLEGALKYVTMNLLASVIFLTAIAMLYGLAGSLNMADLSLRIAEIENRGLVNVTALLFFAGFGIKSAIFPLYFWLPASYHTPPSAISAIFGGLLTKVGVYALLRIFSLIFYGDTFTFNLITVIAILTLISGGVGALVQNNMRKAFAYLIICHIGFMVAGLGMFTTVAITGAVFYLIHDIVIKTNLFMVSGLVLKIKGTENIKKLGGLYAEYPLLSLLVAIPLFSLVGIPPFSGFWPKLSLIQAGFDTSNYILIGIILIASFITLYVIGKIWAEVFWKKGIENKEKSSEDNFENLSTGQKSMMVLPIVFLSIISLFIGFGAEYVHLVSKHIAEELMEPVNYIQAVLGDSSFNTLPK